MAVKVLRVEGMRDNTRTPEELERLEAAERRPLDLNVDGVLDAAREQTGLDDFGPRDFIERLAFLLDEVDADANVWKLHKATFAGQCTQAAGNRLLIQRYWSEHPESRSR